MYKNEILEEVWATKDRLWEQAGGDLRVFVEQLRDHMAKNPPPNPVLRTKEDIERYRQTGELPAAGVREDEAQYGEK